MISGGQLDNDFLDDISFDDFDFNISKKLIFITPGLYLTIYCISPPIFNFLLLEINDYIWKLIFKKFLLLETRQFRVQFNGINSKKSLDVTLTQLCNRLRRLLKLLIKRFK